MEKNLVVSLCEKNMVLEMLQNKLRRDNREFSQLREVEISFGEEFGVCFARSGKTQVVARVTSTIEKPREENPTEGSLFINVQIPSTLDNYLPFNTSFSLSDRIRHSLEKCLKKSDCVDLEGLCIVAGEKAWTIRVEVRVLTRDGGVETCCSVAALAALAHFKKPEVTYDGQCIIIHSELDKEPQPLSIHHYPLIISYAIYNEGNTVLIDPNFLEINSCDSFMTISANNHREICDFNVVGELLSSSDFVLKYTRQAAIIIARLADEIKTALENDAARRKENVIPSLVENSQHSISE